MTNQPFQFPLQGVAPDQFAEVTTFSATLNRAIGFATASQQMRPGKFPDQYTSLTTGRGTGSGIAGALVADTVYGDVWEITGAGIISLRDRVAIEEGAVVFARFLRAQDPADPSGDTVRFRVEWLDETFASIGASDIWTDSLEVADGLIEASGVINAPTANLAPPTGAVYAAAFVETFGTDGKTRVINLGSRPLKSVLADYADAAGTAQQVAVAPTNENETFYPTFVRPATEGNRPVRVDTDLTYNPATNTLSVDNAVVDELDAQSIVLPPEFQFEQVNIPEFPVARTFYVTMDGSDTNTGTSTSKPFRTISRALTAMAAAGVPCVTIVHPGDYLVPRNSVIPRDCALYGYDLRVTKLILANLAGNGPATLDADRQQNMFLMRSGIKVRGFTFTGMRHEPYTFDPLTETGAPPATGYAFAFHPGELIIRSPYIADCTVLHDLTQDQMSLPIDRENGNLLLPRGAGNVYADGSVLSGYSPLRSIVVDSFTAVNPNGVGYVIIRNAIVQLVSVFTHWSRVGIWCHEGGQATLSNSNNTFGDYAFVASGSRQTIRVPDGEVAGLGVYTAAADTLQAETETIISALMGTAPNFNDGLFGSISTGITGWASFTPEQKALTEGDTRRLLKELIGDLRSGQERGAQLFVKGLFDWNGNYIWNVSAVPVTRFIQGFTNIRTAIADHIGGAPLTMVNNLIDRIEAVLDNPEPFRVPFVSVIEYAGQAFSYSGAGVNYNALPFAQRGTGTTPDPTSTILQWSGGRCYGTFSTERGDTYLGNDLRVDFERSTVEGQAFSRGVIGITLPMIVALG